VLSLGLAHVPLIAVSEMLTKNWRTVCRHRHRRVASSIRLGSVQRSRALDRPPHKYIVRPCSKPRPCQTHSRNRSRHPRRLDLILAHGLQLPSPIDTMGISQHSQQCHTQPIPPQLQDTNQRNHAKRTRKCIFHHQYSSKTRPHRTHRPSRHNSSNKAISRRNRRTPLASAVRPRRRRSKQSSFRHIDPPNHRLQVCY
jgi:hypothetical protein